MDVFVAQSKWCLYLPSLFMCVSYLIYICGICINFWGIRMKLLLIIIMGIMTY